MKLPPVYPILDLATLERRRIPVIEAAEALLEAGASILQWRDKRPVTRESFALAEQVAALCKDSGAIWIVNDRADIARILGAGLHLGQDDLPVSLARQVVGDSAMVGLSTHNRAQLEAGEREPVDYLALGPIFGTVNKENPDPVLGVEALRQCRRLTSKPLVAIGGITRRSALAVWQAGADSVAAIGDLYPEKGSKLAVRERMEEWLRLSKP
jgi:thiamine-phosphate pyrophosphorylase